MNDEPRSVRAWGVGASGEEALAHALTKVSGVIVLHDRRVPGTKGNIDHIVIAPGGVFVVDAKNYTGRVELRDLGGFFRHDWRLYIGSRDQSKLADGMGWQISAVKRAIDSVLKQARAAEAGAVNAERSSATEDTASATGAASAIPEPPPITPVLCFVKAEWPLFRPPDSFRGVRVEGEGSIRRLVVKGDVLDGEAIELWARILSEKFPPK